MIPLALFGPLITESWVPKAKALRPAQPPLDMSYYLQLYTVRAIIDHCNTDNEASDYPITLSSVFV
jgi:hypothetical protein